MSKKQVRLEYLDGLRGAAAILVSVVHYLMVVKSEGMVAAWEAPFVTLFTEYFDLGKIGVVIFFAISGFIIPSSFKSGVSKKASVKKFFISRVFRLYPVYWFSIPLGLWAFWIIQEKDFSVSIVFANFTMLQQFVGVKNIIGVYWTLQVEIIFYVLCVMLFLLGKLNDRCFSFYCSIAALVVAILMSYLRGALEVKLPVAVPLALSVMFFGGLWRELTLNKDSEAGQFCIIYLIFFFVSMPIISVFAYNLDMGWGETWYRYLISYYSAITLFCLMTSKYKLVGPVFSYLGRVSYSYYLLHPVCIVFVVDVALPFFGCFPESGLFVVLGTIILAMMLSSLTYSFIEKPSIKVGRVIAERRLGV
ncbi:acyltransferase family protein [Spongiibacter marinus]|uniref:acyltransferase family protein n=1 Tax=Spongiibacter marinus TaxID=354246 RepID=UPI0019609A97|nr:acyltransferase [Spongiibacter marinus]MBM7424645.1 peptidoglycan/LPS O-acetylase OafA/YrhL [Spongiibacter marinus]